MVHDLVVSNGTLVNGTLVNGRSTFRDAQPGGELRSVALFCTSAGPPPEPAPQAGRLIDHGMAPGALRWILVDHDPPERGVHPGEVVLVSGLR